MHILFERWCAWRARTRALMACLMAGVIALFAWALLITPMDAQRAALEAQLTDARQTRAALWSAVARLHRPAKPDEPQTKTAFSALAFQRDGTTLVSWKPFAGGGALTLDADWGQIPAVFSRLAQREMSVEAFEITPEGARLRLSLELHDAH